MTISDIDQRVTLEICPVSHSPVTDTESSLSTILDCCNQVGHTPCSRLTRCDDSVSCRVMESVEDLTLACVDNRCNDVVGVTYGVGKGFEARHGDHRYIECSSDGLTRRQSDAHPREESRSDVHCDCGQFVDGNTSVTADELDCRHHDLGMMPTTRCFERRNHAVGADHRYPDPLCRSLDPENQHVDTIMIGPSRMIGPS